MRCPRLSVPVEIAPMNNRFIHPKIDGFGKNKKEINRLCTRMCVCVCVCVGFNSF